jgi:hypothetical protein
MLNFIKKIFFIFLFQFSFFLILMKAEIKGIVKKIPIKIFLESLGIKANNFNEAPVFYIELEDGRKLISKEYCDEDLMSLFVSLTIPSFCEILNFPKTPNVFIDNKILFQEFVDFEKLNKDDFLKKINSIDKKELDKLKIFYFIFGYLDTCFDNILIKNNDLIVIDMDTCVNISFCRYGEIPYLLIGRFDDLVLRGISHRNFPFDSFKSLSNEEDKKNLFDYLKSIGKESIINQFRLDKRKIKYILFKNNLFIQHFGENHIAEIDYIVPFVKNIDKEIIDKIKTLNEEFVFDLFYKNFALIKCFLKEDEIIQYNNRIRFLAKNIIARKDQVLDYYKNIN